MESANREPVFNAPWPALVIVGAILLSFLWQTHAGSALMIDRYGLSAPAVRAGDLQVLVTWLFLHGGWGHALGNAAFGLAFATAVSRRMGTDAQGAMVFFIFYLLCGVLSGLAFLAVHWGDSTSTIGASGALAGCMGAASRMRGPGPALDPFSSRPVLAMAGAWLVINLVFGLLLIGWAPGSGGAPLSWEAHLGGYAAGLLLIGPALRLLGRA